MPLIEFDPRKTPLPYSYLKEFTGSAVAAWRDFEIMANVEMV
jgi:hypothetical protein